MAFAVVLFAAPTPSVASPVLFDVTGTDISLQSLATNDGFNFYSVYGPGTFDGSILIDTATFSVRDAEIGFTVGSFLGGGGLVFSLIPAPQTGPDVELWAGGPTLYLTIDLTDDAVGGIASWTNSCGPPHDGLCTTYVYDMEGTLVPQTPLPPTGTLMMIGLAALGLLGRRGKVAILPSWP
jgi:hypothetical protein